jgi:hypothetical protein
MYRQANESIRCEFCGGSDIHTATCWSQRSTTERLTPDEREYDERSYGYEQIFTSE